MLKHTVLVVRNLSSKLINLYWNIGRTIKEDIIKNQNTEYVNQIIYNLSKELNNNYGKGYSRLNIFKMVRFYEVFPKNEIVYKLSQRLAWSHIKEIIYLEDNSKREFYVNICNTEGWSLKTLRERIDSRMYERKVLIKNAEETTINDFKSVIEDKKIIEDLFLKDHYSFNYLELKNKYTNKDFQDAILVELQELILEMDSDFNFLERQKRITVGDEEYYIQLLFYHMKMRRHIAVELRLDEFKPEHKRQVEPYLRWLNDYQKKESDETPVCIILYENKLKEKAIPLELDKNGVHVAQQITERSLEKEIIKNFNKAIQKATIKLDKRNMAESRLAAF